MDKLKVDPATVARMGYEDVRATFSTADRFTEVALLGPGSHAGKWAVVIHQGCDPDDPSSGTSGLEDFAGEEEAVQAFREHVRDLEMAAEAVADRPAEMAHRVAGHRTEEIVSRTLALLGEQFPGLPRIDSPVAGDGHENTEAALVTGVNVGHDRYAGAYFFQWQAYFCVVVERHRQENGWGVRLLRKDGEDSETMETGLSADDPDALMRMVAEHLGDFRPLGEPYAIYIAEAGTERACFGAMPAAEWDTLGSDATPGDRIAEVKAESREEALTRFADFQPRSEGFMRMIERGLALSEEPIVDVSP